MNISAHTVCETIVSIHFTGLFKGKVATENEHVRPLRPMLTFLLFFTLNLSDTLTVQENAFFSIV